MPVPKAIIFRLIFPILLLLTVCSFILTAQEQYINLNDRLFTPGFAPLPDSSTLIPLFDSAVKLSAKDPDAAIFILKNVLHAGLVYRLPVVSSDAFAYANTIYNNQGRYDEATQATKKMLLLSKAYNMDMLLPTVYNSMANRYQRIGKLDSAMLYYYKGIEFIEKDTAFYNVMALATLYTNLSGVLESTGDYEKGLTYLIKAEATAKKNGNQNSLALTLINKGNAYNNIGNFKEGILNLKEALQIAREHHYLQWQHLALSNLGSINYEQGKYKEALSYLEEAIQLKGDIDPNYQNTAIAQLGKVYFALKNYVQAENYLLQSLHNAEKNHISRGAIEGNRMLALLYAQTGQHKKAFEYQYAYTTIKDSVENQESRQNINQLDIKYQTAQKDKELVEKELKINKQHTQIRQKNFWIGIIASGTLLLAAMALLAYRMNRHKQRYQSERLRSLEREQEINQLKAMMKGEEKERTRIARELHDGIGGMLASLKMNVSVFKEEHPELQKAPTLHRISDLLSGTAIEVRRTAHNLMPDALDRQSLKEALLLYCENHNNSGLHMELQYHVPVQLSKPAELFIYRIVQELVQNIVKHAKASYAAVQVMLHENELSVTVEDNGIGFDNNTPTRGTGLQNIRSRTEALQGYISLDTTKDKGTTLHIKFDYARLEHL